MEGRRRNIPWVERKKRRFYGKRKKKETPERDNPFEYRKPSENGVATEEARNRKAVEFEADALGAGCTNSIRARDVPEST